MKRNVRFALLIASVVALCVVLSWAFQLHQRTPSEPVTGDRSPAYQSRQAADKEPLGPAAALQPQFESQEADASPPAGHAVGGRVIDEMTRRPVSGAAVSFRYQGSRRPAVAAVQTASDGSFTLTDLPPERVIIQVSATNYAPVEHGVTPPLKSPVEITLSQGGAISGQLLAADGVTGVSGTVELWNVTASSGGTSESQADGQFRLRNLNPGRYRVSGQTRAGRSPAVEVLLGNNERVEGLVLAVRPGRAIRGTVSGLPTADLLRVRVSANELERGSETDADVGSSGTFHIEGVLPGQVQVVAEAPGRRVGKTIQMSAAADATVDLRFTDGVRLTGRVTRRGQPVADAVVSATFNGDIEVSASARTSSTGHYAIDGLVAGEEHDVSVDHRSAGNIRVFDGWVFNVDLADTRVSGRVLRMSGEPLPGAYVMIQSGSIGRGVRSDAEGEFSVTGLEPGEIEVFAYKPGYAWVRQSLQLQNSPAPLTLRLRESAGVEVRARDAETGAPLRELHAFVGVPGERSRIHFRVELDEHGKGSLPAELAGHGLFLTASEYRAIQLDTWNGEPLDLAFEAPLQEAAQ